MIRVMWSHYPKNRDKAFLTHHYHGTKQITTGEPVAYAGVKNWVLAKFPLFKAIKKNADFMYLFPVSFLEEM